MARPAAFLNWLPQFRRSLGYLRPHRRPLVLGLLAAVGVSLFYTFSISSAIPLLKVMFSNHETLADWVHRLEAEHRLGVSIPSDLPDSPDGFHVTQVGPKSPAAGILHDGDRVAAIGGEASGAHELIARVAGAPSGALPNVRVVDADGDSRSVALGLRERRWWVDPLEWLASQLPAGRDPQSRLWTLVLVMVALVAVSLLSSLFRFANEALVATAVQRAMHGMRCDLFDHVLRLPLAWHATQPPGDTLSRFSNDLNRVEVGIWTLFGKTIREPLKAVGVLVLAIMIDWQLLLVAVVGIPIGVAVMQMFGKLVKRAQRRASRSFGRLLDHLDERIAGIRVVKAYNMQREESRQFALEGQNLARAQTHIELVDAATKPSLETLAMFAVAAFVVYGGARVFHREIEPQLFFAAVVCLGGIFDPVRKLGNVNNRLQSADVSAGRVFELVDLRTEEPREPAAAAPHLNPLRKAIEFENVCFAYDSNPDRLVVAEVSLRVEAGRTVALVGPNGSGKTTLMSLLLRFFEPSRGRILIDGQELAAHSLESLRAQIGLVTQDAVIFSGTVRANIAYGANGVADEAVTNAAQQAHIDDFVRLLAVESEGEITSGYDALISSRTLSGGQKQRIALARAILRNPPILILDEATSQVDSESEQRIQEALEDVTRGRTTFIIAHRFSTIRRADQIVVLNEGRVVGHGTHEELLETCPSYVALCRTQFAHAL